MHLMAEGNRMMLYLSGASFFLFFVIQGPGHGAPTFRTAFTVVNILKLPSQIELELCLYNLQGASQCSGVRTKVNPHIVINLWLTLDSVESRLRSILQ